MPLTFAPDKLLGVGSKHLRARTGLRYANIPPGVPNGPFEWVGCNAEDPAVLVETREAFDVLAARRSGEAAPV
jgi:hypothetical protein